MRENLVLYNAVVPKLESGVWTIRTLQNLKDEKGGQIGEEIKKEKQFRVGTNLLSVQTDLVVNRCPLPGESGSFTNTIAHVICKEPEFPWTQIEGRKGEVPAVALLMVKKAELADGGYEKINEITVGEFLKDKPDVVTPALKLTRGEAAATPCRFMRLKSEDFDRIAPRLKELPLLAHCRQVYIGDKAELSLNRDGLFSVIMCNRLPDYDPEGENEYHACLVSLEGMWDRLDGNVHNCGKSYVDLIVLDEWTFEVSGTEPLSFRKFCERVNKASGADSMLRIAKAWDGTAAGSRLEQGYVPMLYHTRTGEEGISWYRSPLVPVILPDHKKETPFYTADSAMIYDAEEGIFDLSYAAAWEAGRMAALQDIVFGQKMQNLRQSGKELTDLLLQRILLESQQECSQSKKGENPADLCRRKILGLNSEKVKEYLLTPQKEEMLTDVLGGEVLARTGAACPFDKLSWNQKDDEMARVTEEMTKLLAYMMETQPNLLSELLENDIKTAAEWLAKLYLLYPVSFDLLIPHQDLLPMEALRFFYLDENWLSACLDGAMSLGMDCSRQNHFNKMMEGLMKNAVEKEMLNYRAALYGEEHPYSRKGPMSGMIIKSSLVSGWPTLELKAADQEGNALALLRMERLSEYVLLAIFDGAASEIRAVEPKESIQMKTEPEFNEFRDYLVRVMDLSMKAGQNSAEFVRPFLTVGDRVIFRREEKQDGR